MQQKIKVRKNGLINMSKYDDLPKPLRKGKYAFIFVMLILSVISWAVFYVYLNINSILMAFKEFLGYSSDGEEMYRWSFSNFRRFWEEMTYDGWATANFKAALKNTLFFYFLGTIWSFPTMFIVSYYIYKKFSGYKLYRVLLYMPSIISSVVMVTIAKNIVAANGLISAISVLFGGEMVTGLITTEKFAKWTLLFYNNWIGFSGAYIILTGAMNRIPQEVIESAQLDGVGKLREFFQIIIPLIWPTLHIIILTKITSFFAADAPILLFTGGKYDTYTIGFWYYDQIILSHSYEYPAAVGLIMTLFLTPIAVIARKLLDKVYADVEF